VSGPAAVALLVAEVGRADEALQRMQAKQSKAARYADELAETAEAGVEQAQADLDAALDAAQAATGRDRDGLRELAAEMVAEMDRHAAEMDRLAAGPGGEG
jgi:hypothetical protein